MLHTLVVFLVIAIWMQVKSNRKNACVYNQTHGVVKSNQDLLAVKSAINLSMRLAVIYIILYVLFIIILGIFVARGESLGHAALSLFVFGVVTLPIGLVGKRYEKKIKTMQVQADDPEIADRFQQYLKQWDKARFQLSD